MIKALFLDFDGTTFSHKTSCMPDSCLSALKKVQEKGIKVFLCTGRSKPEMKMFDLKGFVFDGSILSNGQLFLDRDNKVVFSYPLQGSLKEELITLFLEKKIPTSFATEDEFYINFVNDFVETVQNDISSGIPPVKEYHGEDIYMASIFVDIDENKDRIMKLKDVAEITLWHEGAVDVASKGVTKASAIEKVLEVYDFTDEEIMGFGDGQNDIPMLKKCHIGVAMGNATKEVKDIADYITDDIDDDGLSNALKHFSII